MTIFLAFAAPIATGLVLFAIRVLFNAMKEGREASQAQHEALAVKADRTEKTLTDHIEDEDDRLDRFGEKLDRHMSENGEAHQSIIDRIDHLFDRKH